MNKINYLVERYGLEKKKNICFGRRGNYHILYEYKNSYNAYISINVTEDLKQKVTTIINKLPNSDLIANLEVLNKVIKIKTNIKTDEDFSKFDNLISSILTSLSTNMITAGGGINYKEYYTKTSIGLGILGALLGAIVGSIIYGIIYQLGYISYIGSIAIVLATYKGCVLFGKRFGVLEIIICLVISLLSIAATLYCCYTIAFYQELVKYYDVTYFDALKNLIDVFVNDNKVMRAFTADLFISYFFLMVGGIIVIVNKIKQSKAK